MEQESRDDAEDPKLLAAIGKVLISDAFTKHSVKVIEHVLERRGVEKRCYPKKHVCTRCCMPRNPCRPMVSVMMLPIPFLNPFGWAETCHPRPCGCGSSIPEGYREGSDPQEERPPVIEKTGF